MTQGQLKGYNLGNFIFSDNSVNNFLDYELGIGSEENCETT